MLFIVPYNDNARCLSIKLSQYNAGYVFCIGLIILCLSFNTLAQASANNSAKTNQQLSDIQQAINQQKQ
ncbi:MAG: hypothetical protein ACJA1K_001761, partial [Cognaticolwellia sp.]